MKNIFCLFLFLISNVIFADERPKMTEMVPEPSDTNAGRQYVDDSSLKNFIQNLANFISKEDLSACESCYKTFNRKETAIFFAEHTVTINLIDFHVVSNNGKNAEVAVKYSMIVDKSIITYISFIQLEKINGNWKVLREKICKKNWENPTCANGRCGLATIPKFDQPSAPPQQNCETGTCSKVRIPMGMGFPELEDF